jgi:hypothetical protein
MVLTGLLRCQSWNTVRVLVRKTSTENPHLPAAHRPTFRDFCWSSPVYNGESVLGTVMTVRDAHPFSYCQTLILVDGEPGNRDVLSPLWAEEKRHQSIGADSFRILALG